MKISRNPAPDESIHRTHAQKLRQLARMIERLGASKPSLSPEARQQIERQVAMLRAELGS